MSLITGPLLIFFLIMVLLRMVMMFRNDRRQHRLIERAESYDPKHKYYKVLSKQAREIEVAQNENGYYRILLTASSILQTDTSYFVIEVDAIHQGTPFHFELVINGEIQVWMDEKTGEAGSYNILGFETPFEESDTFFRFLANLFEVEIPKSAQIVPRTIFVCESREVSVESLNIHHEFIAHFASNENSFHNVAIMIGLDLPNQVVYLQELDPILRPIIIDRFQNKSEN